MPPFDLLHRHADWNGLLDAAYASALNDHAWAVNLVARTVQIFGAEFGAELVVVKLAPHARSPTADIIATCRGKTKRAFHESDVELVDGTTALAATRSEIQSRLRNPAGKDDDHARHGSRDILWLIAHLDDGVRGVLAVPFPAEPRLDRHALRTFSRAALHLESSWRLRWRPDRIRALLMPDGRLLHHGGTAPPSELTHADTWRALIAGETSVLPRLEGATKQFVLVDSAPARYSERALTTRESAVLERSARGLSGKLIGHGLDLSSATVSATLSTIAAKAGAKTRLDLIRIAALLVGGAPARLDRSVLTRAEHDVLELVRDGWSNEDIAQHRSRSIRTIENQIASILRKTQSATRRALLAAH